MMRVKINNFNFKKKSIHIAQVIKIHVVDTLNHILDVKGFKSDNRKGNEWKLNQKNCCDKYEIEIRAKIDEQCDLFDSCQCQHCGMLSFSSRPLNLPLACDKNKREASSLYWLILVFFYALFVQGSIFALANIFKHLKINCWLQHFVPSYLTHKMYLCVKMQFCSKRASKIIVPPIEILLSFSIGTF